MINKEFVKIEVAFNGSLNVMFVAQETRCEKGVIYEEKNNEKNISDLTHITVFEKEMCIMLKSDVLYLTFNIVSSNAENMIGEYEVTFFGHPGIVRISKYDFDK